MHQVLYVLLVVSTGCLAHYRGYGYRNFIEREEPHAESEGTLVECPVCESSPSGIPSYEECDVLKGNKKYKTCNRGTYLNDVCGNRLDCYRGPGEQCTEKMNYDYYGQKCARGYYCDGTLHVCTGLDYTADSRQRFLLSHLHTYPAHARKDDFENSMFFA